MGERDSGKGVGGAVRGHYGFMHNVEMSGSGFKEVPAFPRRWE